MDTGHEQDFQSKVNYLLGKLDGKVDTLLHNQTVWISRVEDSEKRISINENRITSLEVRADEKKINKSTIMSLVSLAIAAAVAFANIAKEWLK